MRFSFSADSFADLIGLDITSEQARARKAVTAGGTKAQQVLRSQTQAAGLGSGVSNAWQLNVYPKGGRADNPAAYVFTKAQRIVDAFSTGAVITAHQAEWLVIALPAAKALGLDKMSSRPGSRAGGNSARYSNVTAAIEQFGALRFVSIGGNRALLVADSRRGSPSGRRASAKVGNGAALFLLVKSVRDRKALDLEAARQAGQQAMVGALS